MTPIYVINLARRPDRLAAMTRALDAAGLAFTRIDAIDAKSADAAWVDAQFAPSSALRLTAADKACTLSHFRAYETFLSSPDVASASHAIIFEDDVHLAEAAGALLSSCGWLAPSLKLLKLESFGPRPVLLGPAARLGGADGPAAAALLSKHLGAAGYIISRSTAAALLAIKPKPYVLIDHLLFNPERSPIFDWLAPSQLLPAVVRQNADMGSDLAPSWSRAKTQTRVHREITRLRLQAPRLPRLAAALCLGGARFRRVEFEPGV